MKDPNSIAITQLTLNSNFFVVIPTLTRPGKPYLAVYDIFLYTAEHTSAERDQMLDWIATANNL